MAIRNKNLQQVLENACCELLMIDSSDDDEEERIFEELEDNACIFAGQRFSFRGNVPKSFQWYDEILPNMDDKRFRTLLRCTRKQFNIILALIENHPVFHGVNSCKQFTVQFQLALVLYRLGSNGDAATTTKIATLFGIGDGSTSKKITERVFESILALESKFIYWPNKKERDELVLASFKELPHCIGYVVVFCFFAVCRNVVDFLDYIGVLIRRYSPRSQQHCIGYTDGTIIPLKERPSLDHVSYYSKDQVYALKLQSVCDFRLTIRQITVGYPGCVHDARIYNNCKLATHPERLFCGQQYLVNDSAYKLTTTVITPFKQNSVELTQKRRASFNKYLSKYRVRIEHSFGILKEKLPSLKLLSVQIRDAKSHQFACTWIRVCCVLYNILLPHFDEDDLEPTKFNYSNNADEYNGYDDNDNDEAGKCKRIALVEVIEAK